MDAEDRHAVHESYTLVPMAVGAIVTRLLIRYVWPNTDIVNVPNGNTTNSLRGPM